MVTELCSFPFSSYPAFIGQVKAPKWLELNCLLSLFGQSRRAGAKKNTARDVAIYLAWELSVKKSGVDLGRYFGNICGAAVTARYKHISVQISRNRRLKGRVNRVMNRILNN
jgi:hypothetical protein